MRGLSRWIRADRREPVDRRRLHIRELLAGVDLGDAARIEVAAEPRDDPLLLVAAREHALDDGGVVVRDPHVSPLYATASRRTWSIRRATQASASSSKLNRSSSARF